MTRIKLMADYSCWPLWKAGGGEVGNIDPSSLPLSPATRHSLNTWASHYNSWLNRTDPSLSGPKSDADEEAFCAEGRRLWRLLQSELPGYDVIYQE
jgi:hypothetical protein